MDVVTVIGLVVVTVMFCSGVALVWLGLRRRPDRLPQGAEEILAAVAAGHLAVPIRTTASRRESSASPTSSAGADPGPDAGIDLRHPPAVPPRAVSATPAVRLVPAPPERPTGPARPARPARPGGPVPPQRPGSGVTPEPREAPAPVTASTRDDTADLTDALFGS